MLNVEEKEEDHTGTYFAMYSINIVPFHLFRSSVSNLKSVLP